MGYGGAPMMGPPAVSPIVSPISSPLVTQPVVYPTSAMGYGAPPAAQPQAITVNVTNTPQPNALSYTPLAQPAVTPTLIAGRPDDEELDTQDVPPVLLALPSRPAQPEVPKVHTLSHHLQLTQDSESAFDTRLQTLVHNAYLQRQKIGLVLSDSQHAGKWKARLLPNQDESGIMLPFLFRKGAKEFDSALPLHLRFRLRGHKKVKKIVYITLPREKHEEVLRIPLINPFTHAYMHSRGVQIPHIFIGLVETRAGRYEVTRIDLHLANDQRPKLPPGVLSFSDRGRVEGYRFDQVTIHDTPLVHEIDAANKFKYGENLILRLKDFSDTILVFAVMELVKKDIARLRDPNFLIDVLSSDREGVELVEIVRNIYKQFYVHHAKEAVDDAEHVYFPSLLQLLLHATSLPPIGHLTAEDVDKYANDAIQRVENQDEEPVAREDSYDRSERLFVNMVHDRIGLIAQPPFSFLGDVRNSTERGILAMFIRRYTRELPHDAVRKAISPLGASLKIMFSPLYENGEYAENPEKTVFDFSGEIVMDSSSVMYWIQKFRRSVMERGSAAQMLSVLLATDYKANQFRHPGLIHLELENGVEVDYMPFAGGAFFYLPEADYGGIFVGSLEETLFPLINRHAKVPETHKAVHSPSRLPAAAFSRTIRSINLATADYSAVDNKEYVSAFLTVKGKTITATTAVQASPYRHLSVSIKYTDGKIIKTLRVVADDTIFRVVDPDNDLLMEEVILTPTSFSLGELILVSREQSSAIGGRLSKAMRKLKNALHSRRHSSSRTFELHHSAAPSMHAAKRIGWRHGYGRWRPTAAAVLASSLLWPPYYRYGWDYAYPVRGPYIAGRKKWMSGSRASC